MAGLATRRSFLRAGALAAGALCLGAAGCDGGDGDVPAEPAPVNPSEGMLGGKLVLYTSCSESLVNAVVPAFMESLGVAVSVVRGSTADLLARVADEAASGRPAADVVWGGDASWYAGDATAGLLEEYVSAENGAMREGCGSVDGRCTPVTREVGVIAVAAAFPTSSTDEAAGGDTAGEGDASGGVADESLPPDRVTGYRTLAGLGAAGGEVALESPETSDAGLAFITGVDACLSGAEAAADEGASVDSASAGGTGVAEGPTDNAPVADLMTYDPNAPWEYLGGLLGSLEVVSADEVGDGEAALDAVLLDGARAAFAFEQGCAVAARECGGIEVVYPEEGLTVTRGCTAVVGGCENLVQARAWVDFVTGQECQQLIVTEALGRPVREDVSDPEGLPEVGEVTAVDRERLVSTWAAVVDGSWEPAE